MPNLDKESTKMIIIGVNLMVLSCLLFLMMTIKIMEPNFILIFASYSLSLAGLVIGFYGLYGLYHSLLTRRNKESKG